MSLEFTLGKMVDYTKVSTKQIKSMAMEFTLGLIISNMLDGGIMANSMV
jgi:hypothetical protein